MSAYSRFFTQSALSRKPSPIRVLTQIQSKAGPELISLAAGAPNPATFPFESISVKIAGNEVCLSGKSLQTALQYSATPGIPSLLKYLEGLQSQVHNFDGEKHSIIVTTGSQDGLGKALEALIGRGDKVIVDTPIYSGTLAAMRPLSPELIGIRTDDAGMDTYELERSLNEEAKGAKLLITVTNGSNPTGGSISEERRKHMLELAEKYDFFIIEDDPYYWLDYGDKVPSLFNMSNGGSAVEDIAPGGRVLRTDSLSKIVSSGLRLGWLTGPSDIIDKVALHQQASTMHTSTLNQTLVTMLFDQWNGTPGFVTHTEKVTDFYRKQCDAIVASCEKHLSGLATWAPPKAGMFLWLTVPGVPDTKSLIQSQALKNNVLLVHGEAFMPNDEQSNCMRLSFSQETPERMDEAVKRLGVMIRAEQTRLENAAK